MNKEILADYKKAGDIAKQAKSYAKKLVKAGAEVKTIVENIESKIAALGGKSAFPVNISINEVAAHYTARVNDKRKLKEGDLVKIDIGVHVNGYVADTAQSFTIGTSLKNEALISAAETALNAAVKIAKPGVKLRLIGKVIQNTVKERGFQVIRNLRGHGVGRYVVHGEPSVPNFDSGDQQELKIGNIIAIEPFTTTGEGIVIESKGSEIYSIVSDNQTRYARDVLEYIKSEFKTLPFAKRHLVNKFGLLKTSLAIKHLLAQRIIKEYPILRERTNGVVAQAEHTIIILDKPIIIT